MKNEKEFERLLVESLEKQMEQECEDNGTQRHEFSEKFYRNVNGLIQQVEKEEKETEKMGRKNKKIISLKERMKDSVFFSRKMVALVAVMCLFAFGYKGLGVFQQAVVEQAISENKISEDKPQAVSRAMPMPAAEGQTEEKVELFSSEEDLPDGLQQSSMEKGVASVAVIVAFLGLTILFWRKFKG